jgi:hypothetical protein
MTVRTGIVPRVHVPTTAVSAAGSSTPSLALPDSIQVLQKMKEFGVLLPIMGNGVWLLMPETVRAVGRDLIEGVMSSVAAHPLRGQEALVPGRIRYDERGRRAGATTIIVQWQGGEPFTVAPSEFATRKPLWQAAH